MATLNVIFVLSNQGLFSLMPGALLIARSSALFMVCPFKAFHYRSGAVDYTAFSVWFISFRIITLHYCVV